MGNGPSGEGPLPFSQGARSTRAGEDIPLCPDRTSKCFALSLMQIPCWIYESFDTFFMGCCCIYADRLCVKSKLACCIPCCNDVYVDSKFVANTSSLGNWGLFGSGKRSDGEAAFQAKYEWRRAGDLFVPLTDEQIAAGSDCMREAPPAYLFEGRIQPEDIAQGQLGDCWMMSALACMAEHPASIANNFVTKEYNVRGKYTVRLYDGFDRKWRKITVDDYFPVHRLGFGDDPAPGSQLAVKTLFAQPNGRELWALLYEKAFAKMLGGYDKLDGGNLLVAFQAFTGDPVFHLSREDGGWRIYDLVMKKKDKRENKIGLSSRGKHMLSEKQMFKVLRKFIRRKAVIGAGTSGKDEGTKTAKQGLVQGHAYSILDVREPKEGSNLNPLAKKFRLVKLRNPWGSFEWSGPWSQGSEEWAEHPRLAAKVLRDRETEKGTFWMNFTDFTEHFDQIDLCDRTTGFRDIYLDYHDDTQGCAGPMMGCIKGCTKFWGLCEGCRATTFGHTGAWDRFSRETKGKVMPA